MKEKAAEELVVGCIDLTEEDEYHIHFREDILPETQGMFIVSQAQKEYPSMSLCSFLSRDSSWVVGCDKSWLVPQKAVLEQWLVVTNAGWFPKKPCSVCSWVGQIVVGLSKS